MLELAERILSLTESRSKIVFQSLPQDDPSRRKPDITLAKSALNWTPSIELEEGLRKTIAYFRGLSW
jgi:UDP-glucuronate decarboxylase